MRRETGKGSASAMVGTTGEVEVQDFQIRIRRTTTTRKQGHEGPRRFPQHPILLSCIVMGILQDRRAGARCWMVSSDFSLWHLR